MDIYLASVLDSGGVKGAFRDYWSENIGCESRRQWSMPYTRIACLKEAKKNMDIYLAAPHCYPEAVLCTAPQGACSDINKEALAQAPRHAGWLDIFLLESFYYANEWTERLIPCVRKFLLDSGAFTFFTKDQTVNWDEYIERYATFINRNHVDLFFELDIDPVVGYAQVLALRRKLERLTRKQCIPVWHKSRGKEEFLRMCDEYPYVAIGGIVTKEIRQKDYGLFPWFIREAHKRGAKIHGLGFTNINKLPLYHFDSVDSTAWNTGNRFGHLYRFTGHTIVQSAVPQGCRITNSRAAAVHNLNEWVKFARYAERNFRDVRQPHEKNRSESIAA